MTLKVIEHKVTEVTDLASFHNQSLKDLIDKVTKIIPLPKIDPADLEYVKELINIIKKLLPNADVPEASSLNIKKSANSLKDLWDLIRKLFPDLNLPEWPVPNPEPEPEPEPGQIIPLGVQAVGAKVLWDQGITGKGVLVGIIDTGIIKHKDFGDRIKIKRNYTGEILKPSHEHGTHVAGTIAANGGIVGVAKDADLADYRVLNRQGFAMDDLIAKALKEAADDGCNIINMSLGGETGSESLEQAVKYAYEKGALVICAAGNEGDGRENTNEYAYPAMYEQVLSVASVDYNNLDKPSVFSNSNEEVDCCSHGERVLSTGKANQYVELTGTSMACPHIAGVAALIYQQRKEAGLSLAVDDLKQAILDHAKDIYLEGRDNSTGYGFVTLNE